MPGWREQLKLSPGAGRLDPGTMSLGVLLAGINVLLVILVIGGISWIAVDLLRDLADDQGLAQVQVAASSVREDIRDLAEETLAGVAHHRPSDRRCRGSGGNNASGRWGRI